MNKIIGNLLTGYALYTLTGAGLLVVFWVLASWYITCVFGWIAEGAFIVLTIIVANVIIEMIIRYIKKNSIFYNQENWDNRKKDN